MNIHHVSTSQPYKNSKRVLAGAVLVSGALRRERERERDVYYIYIYIYIERERDIDMYIHMYIHIIIYIYIYIYNNAGAVLVSPLLGNQTCLNILFFIVILFSTSFSTVELYIFNIIFLILFLLINFQHMYPFQL